MNKFSELAAKIKSGNAFMNSEADALSAEVDETMAVFNDAVGKHRSILKDARSGVDAMKDAANTMSNFDPNAESRGSSTDSNT